MKNKGKYNYFKSNLLEFNRSLIKILFYSFEYSILLDYYIDIDLQKRVCEVYFIIRSDLWVYVNG